MVELLEKVLVGKDGLSAIFVAGFGGLFSGALFSASRVFVTLIIDTKEENDIKNLYNNKIYS